MAVERMSAVPVIEDDQVAITREWRSIGHDSIVDSGNRLSFSERNLDSVPNDLGSRGSHSLSSETTEDDAISRPRKRASEWTERQICDDRSSGLPNRHLQLLLG